MATQRTAGQPIDGTTLTAFPVPLLAEALEPLRNGEYRSVLDLGAASEANVAHFSGTRCRLGIAHAMAELAAASAEEVDLEAILPRRLFGGTDLFLCWDLMDYLDQGVIRRLGAHLLSLANPGAQLHALVAYGVPLVPSQPRGYRLGDGGVLPSPVPASDPGCRPPRHSSGELQRFLPDWRVDRSVLLRNGFQEYRLHC